MCLCVCLLVCVEIESETFGINMQHPACLPTIHIVSNLIIFCNVYAKAIKHNSTKITFFEFSILSFFTRKTKEKIPAWTNTFLLFSQQTSIFVFFYRYTRVPLHTHTNTKNRFSIMKNTLIFHKVYMVLKEFNSLCLSFWIFFKH